MRACTKMVFVSYVCVCIFDEKLKSLLESFVIRRCAMSASCECVNVSHVPNVYRVLEVATVAGIARHPCRLESSCVCFFRKEVKNLLATGTERNLSVF